MVASGDAELGVPIDDARLLRGDRNVGEQAAHEPGPDRGATDRAHHRFRAIYDVVDEVARFLPVLRADLEILDDAVDHFHFAAGRKGVALARQDHGRHVGVGVDVAPDLAEFAVHALISRVQLARVAHADAQNSLGRRIAWTASGGPPDFTMQFGRRRVHRGAAIQIERIFNLTDNPISGKKYP